MKRKQLHTPPPELTAALKKPRKERCESRNDHSPFGNRSGEGLLAADPEEYKKKHKRKHKA